MFLVVLLNSFLLVSSGESHVEFTAVNEGGKDGMRSIDDTFSIPALITNTLDESIEDVTVQYIRPESIIVQAIKIEDVVDTIYTNLDGVHTVKPLLAGRGQVSFSLSVTLIDTGLASGYHLANMAVNITWRVSGTRKTSGLLPLTIAYLIPGCETLFEVANGELREDQVTATSFYVNSPPRNFGPSSTGWCAMGQDKQQHLEILFTRKVRIVSLSSGPRDTKDDEVAEFFVWYLDDLGTWRQVEENGRKKLFKGEGKVINNATRTWLLSPILGNGIRIQPHTWPSPLICAKLAVVGCYISQKDNCINALGMESGVIPREALIDNKNDVIAANDARLNKQVVASPYGWHGDWLDIKLTSLFKVTRIGMQNGYDSDKVSVTSFKLYVSNDTENWTPVIENGNKEFRNLTNEVVNMKNYVGYKTLVQPLITRNVRVEVVDFVNSKTLRMELYGCPVLPRIPPHRQDVSESLYMRGVLVDVTSGVVIMCQYNQKGSSCYSSKKDGNFRKWKALPEHIVQVVGVDDENVTYAITKHNTPSVNTPGRDQWMGVSRQHRTRPLRSTSVILPAIAGIRPNKQWQWLFNDDTVLSVTGVGLHKKYLDSDWALLASWSCCLM